jgi:DNA mismatch endonuclease (patch repair protein)
MPKTRQVFWSDKFASNVKRDNRVSTELRALGWRVVTIWECETGNELLLVGRLQEIFRQDKEAVEPRWKE